MRVYNTLTRKKEEFKPIDPSNVRMYSCGPTVYGYAHIGNMRTYLFMDSLTRALRANGYPLTTVMNITDVGHLTDDGDNGEDKMQKAAAKQKKTPWEIAEFYTTAFFRDIDELNITRPVITPRATEHISDMISFVQGLEEKGFGYETSDGIYFDIGRFPGYGKLSCLNLDDQKAGARVEVNAEKHHPADFALWKKAPKEHIMQWESPWGMGYPGWHIECSAMSRRYLGDAFDIHTGGVDHIPVHHENEIAQSEALLGHPAVNYWMHSEFMMVNNGKMSKSLGNTYTVQDLKAKGYHPLAFRYFCQNAHYRNKINFTFEAMDAAQTAYLRVLEAVSRHKAATPIADQTEYVNAFTEAVNDDLNIPKALGILHSLLKQPADANVYAAAVKFDEILGLKLADCDTIIGEIKELTKPNAEVDPELSALLEQRAAARKEKNWAEADRIRGLIAEKGYTVKDTANGPVLEKI